jgi:large repetitive protein
MGLKIKNSKNIVTDGLVLNLDASDKLSYSGSGSNCIDRTENSNNGTFQDDTAFNSSNGGSFVFDGTDDYILISDSDSLDVTNITMEAWVKISSGQTNSYPRVIDKTNSYYLYFPSGENITVALAGGQLDATANLDSNTWYHIVGCYDGRIINIYKNSQLIATKDLGSNANIGQGNYNLSIGDRITGGRCLNGNIASVRIYESALTSAQILQNYNATKSRFGL